MNRHPNLQDRKQSALLVIDIQERIAQVMQQRQAVIDRTSLLIQGFDILNLPVFFTEQYPKGLGPTEPALRKLMGDRKAYEKSTFSVCGQHDLVRDIESQGIHQIVVAGIETHVCVMQSALELKYFGMQVAVCADAVTSRKPLDHDTALDRMRQQKITVTTAEMALFELLYTSGTDEFKQISKLIK